MLRSMRESTQGWPARILLVLIIAAFAFWGVQGIGQGSAPPVAKVGDSRISQQEFLLAFQNEVGFRARSTEGEYTTQDGLEDGLDRMVLERLIVATALDEHAEDLGLRASDQMVNDYIVGIPAFQDTQGQFDQFTYQQQLDRLQQSHQQFFEERREEIERQHLAQTLVGGVEAPEPMTQAILNYNLERRTADYFTISYADMTAIQTPTEPEIRAYYEANPGEFTAPEYRGLTFLTIRVPQVISRVEVGEERIRQEYEFRQNEFGDPETRDLQIVILPTEPEIQDLQAAVEGGSDIIDAGDDAGVLRSEITFEGVARSDIDYMGEAVVEAAFSAESGAIAGPVEGDLGWALVRVDGIDEGNTASFDDVKEEIRTDLEIQEAELLVEDLANQAIEEVAAGATIEEVGQRLNIPVQSVNTVNRAGIDQNGNMVDEMPPSRNFYDSAFSKTPESYVDVEETEGGGYFLVRVNNVIPSQLEPFEEVREEARAQVVKEKQEEAARARAEELKALAEAEGFEKAAEEAGASIESTEEFFRSQRGVPAAFSLGTVSRLFEAQEGAVVTTPNATNDGLVIAKVTAALPPDTSANPETVALFRDQLLQSYRDDLFRQYQAMLLDRYSVSRNQAVIRELLSLQDSQF